jgi:RNA polymerase sigma-70 factor (ECF subfamily)
VSESIGLARRVFEQHGSALHRYFRRLTGDAGAAEDLTQEVFLRVVRGGARYEPRERERAWVFRIARNVLLDRHRQNSRAPSVEFRAESVTAAPQATRASLREALSHLPADEREAFLLREIGGLAYGEIAAATDSTVPAVRSRIYRARLALRDKLIPPAPIVPGAFRTHDDHD